MALLAAAQATLVVSVKRDLNIVKRDLIRAMALLAAAPPPSPSAPYTHKQLKFQADQIVGC